ncbi:MAG: DUF1844 domain-containing protein [Actinomycetota bacterium]
MAEKKEDKKTAKGGAGKPAPGKTTAKKPAAKKAAAKKAAEDKPRKEAKPEEKPPREEFEALLDAEAEVAAQEEDRNATIAEEKEELSEEEFRRLVEESLETVTVADIVLTMMNQLASVGYMKMGLPENVNLKYRDFSQARLAIDTLEAMIKAAEEKVPPELLQPFRGTLANMQMNFVQLMRGQP